MAQQIYNQLRSMIARCVDVREEDFLMDANLRQDYGVDSVEFIELAREIEKEFNIAVKKSDKETWESGASIYSFIVDKNIFAE